MNREETLALYAQGREAWNKWANELLAEKKKLKESGLWKISKGYLESAQNKETKAWFKKAEANFSSLQQPNTFKEKFICSKFIFPGETKFVYASFQDQVSFEKAKFKRKAFFLRTTFLNHASFLNAKFYGNAYFDNSKFLKELIFSSVFFKKEASFSSCDFQNYAGFKDVFSKGYINFNKSTFSKHALFHGSKFSSFASFYNCTFTQPSRFDRVIFEGNLDFNNSKFKKAIGFRHTIFNGFTTFRFIIAEGIIDFSNSVFSKTTLFSDSIFKNNVNFNYSHFEKNTNFSHSSFFNKINFDAVSVQNAFSLEGSHFKRELPSFIQSHFVEAPHLNNITFSKTIVPGSCWNSITKPVSIEAKARYQALKRLAIQAHDHENEQRFWAGELRSDRSLRGRNSNGKLNIWRLFSPVWYGNILYDLLSDYGRSIVRPLIAWISLTTLVTALHIYAHAPGKDNCNICVSAAHVAVKTGSLGLIQDPSKRIVFVRDYACLYGTHNDKKQTPKIPGYILLAEGFQALVSAILIFLFLLGLRNNFKLK